MGWLETCTQAEYIVSWAENSSSLYRELVRLSELPVHAARPSYVATTAAMIAGKAVNEIISCREGKREDFPAATILEAAGLMLHWRVVR